MMLTGSKSRRKRLQAVVVLLSIALHPRIVSSREDTVEISMDGTMGEIPPPQQQECAAWTGAECSWEPNLQPMTVDFGPTLQETFYAYVTPDVSTFYNESVKARTAVAPRFAGCFGKFINLSPNTLSVYWDPGSKNQQGSFIATLEPFGSSGTATYVGHKFFATLQSQPRPSLDNALIQWTIEKDNSLYYYDPYGSSAAATKELDEYELPLYQMQLQNLVFAQQYKQFTGGTEWLALYKQKKPPRYHMWRADAIGQTHVVETQEIHFTEQPDQAEIVRGMSIYGPRPDEVQRMRRYRDQHPTLTLELKVLSCAPRVFEIQNFLSDVEVEHILNIASNTNLYRSTVSASGAGTKSLTGEESSTRTSRNNWIARHTDFMVDAIYKRAADVLKMNEALLRARRKSELPEAESDITVAEKLQLVHYNVGQKYTPHHDFAMPGLVSQQPSRFATMLFYLNDDMQGGETTFPRWLNAETSQPLSVKPERGKAILFYNMLPDGNYDERSQHEAKPVLEGEKWLTNLWIWDPVLDHTVADHA